MRFMSISISFLSFFFPPLYTPLSLFSLSSLLFLYYGYKVNNKNKYTIEVFKDLNKTNKNRYGYFAVTLLLLTVIVFTYNNRNVTAM